MGSVTQENVMLFETGELMDRINLSLCFGGLRKCCHLEQISLCWLIVLWMNIFLIFIDKQMVMLSLSLYLYLLTSKSSALFYLKESNKETLHSRRIVTRMAIFKYQRASRANQVGHSNRSHLALPLQNPKPFSLFRSFEKSSHFSPLYLSLDLFLTCNQQSQKLIMLYFIPLRSGSQKIVPKQ